MLEPAYSYQKELKELYARKIYNPKNKFYVMNRFYNFDLNIDPDEIRRIQYISKSPNGKMMMYLGAWVNRSANIVERIETINLSDTPNCLVGRDMLRFIGLLLCERNFDKVIFYVIKDNPIFQSYCQFQNHHKLGRIVGIFERHCTLPDGTSYDVAAFEIHKDNFVSSLGGNLGFAEFTRHTKSTLK